ncbi:MAG: SDR family NAD(P)-dependent oxidoreductase [Thermoplasmata archaeon]
MNYFYRGKTILVTGAAGFLGSHLVERLCALGAHVVAIDATSAPVFFRAIPEQARRIRFEHLDITRATPLASVIREARPDVLFHLAAIASPRACARDFVTAYEVNVHGTFNVLRVSESVPHLVFLSSAAVYGPLGTERLDESHPRDGRDPYAMTKIMGETLCENYIANYGRKISIIRNFNAFGPRQPAEYVIPTIIQQALTTGRIELWNAAPVRDLMFVDNTEDAILTIGAQPNAGVFNVGSGRGVRIGELADLIAQKVGGQVPVEDRAEAVTGTPTLVADVSRLKALGWEERVPFDVGLSRTVDWYRG